MPYTSGVMYALTLIPLLLALAWLLGVGGLIALLVLMVVTTIVAAALHASPRPPEMRIGWGKRLACWLGEIAAGLAIILVTMPLERLIMRRDVAARRADTWPVLLVSGHINNAGALWTLRDELIKQGYGVNTLNLEPTYTDIDNYAPQIEARVRDVLARTGAAQVVLVGHSMGALAIRACLRRFPQLPVARVICLGAPHHGTVMARAAAGRNGAQMRPGSPWLAQLAADEGGRWPCPMVSLFSYDDNIVAPQESAVLAGARNLPVAGVGHMSLPLSRPVARLVAGEIGVRPEPGAAPA
jgi:predicted alpha/beta hydrolase family esterase